MKFELHHGDCLDVMKGLDLWSVDAIVTDPPAGIGFMGKEWDDDKGGRDGWVAFLKDRLVEARYLAKPGAYALIWALPRTSHWTATAIEDAGWRIADRLAHVFGTGFPKHKSKLKPAVEDWWLAWNPDDKATLLPGLDACRVPAPGGLTSGGRNRGSSPNPMNREAGVLEDRERSEEHPNGRWPTPLLLSHSPDCADECVEGCPIQPMGEAARFFTNLDPDPFFYCPKASTKERNGAGRNNHPTVKPQALMSWLVTLITPPGGVVLDPFTGSGSTGVACAKGGYGFIGIEKEAEYFEIAKRRIEHSLKGE